MLNKSFFFSLLVLINVSLSASECVAPSLGENTDTPATNPDDPSPKQISIFAEEVSSTRNQYSFKDDVEVRYQGQTIRTDIAEYDADTGTFTTPNAVSLSSEQAEIKGMTANFDLVERKANFNNAEFSFSDGTRGSAGQIELQEDGKQTLKDVRFTSCPKDHTGWELIAPEIVLDQKSQRGYARNMRLEFADIPLFYLPYFSFPLNNQRKSGFLMPNIGTSDKSGVEISLPIYWNIRPNLDLTTTPRMLSDRGTQFQNEFRHLLPYSAGTLQLDFLRADSIRDLDRHHVNLQNRLEFGERWDASLDIQDVSDQDYFIDFGGNLNKTAITNLNREASLGYYGEFWTIEALAQDYQVISPSISDFQEPYQRLPSITASAHWPKLGFHGLSLQLDSEFVNFERDAGIEGLRLHVFPQINYQWTGRAISVNSLFGLDLSEYSLKNTLSGAETQPTRAVPVVNLDARLHFEREVADGLLPQTLEPRVQYTYIPYRDQSELPIFDTGLPDLTQNQLFSPWRFSGLDRIGDTHQVAVGLSSRLLGKANGQSLRFDLGQILFFDDRQVSLSASTAPRESSSLVVGEAYWQLNPKWTVQGGLSWDGQEDQHAKRNLAFSYRPDERKLLNMGYRSVRGSLDQTDLAVRYPINERFNFVGRWNFDRLNNITLDRYWGLEYDTCCWGIRAISRRYISDREGNSDTAFLLQLELKGLTSVGARADRLLQQSIFTDSP